MKRNILVSLGEMRTFRYFFLLNVVISSILVGVAILVMSLAIKLPDNIYKEVKNSELGSINISNIRLSDLEYLIGQNYIIDSYGYDMLMENYITNFTDYQKEIITTKALDSGMQFEYYRQGKNNETLKIWAHCDSSLSEFLRIIGKLKSEYFIVDSFDDTIHSMEFIIYILYVCSAILFILALQVITSLNKVYYNRRSKFWDICYNMGLTNKDICYMNIILSESILVLTFFIGTILAIRLNNYFLVYMQDLFSFSTLGYSISKKAILLLFLYCSILICALTYCSKMSKKGNKEKW